MASSITHWNSLTIIDVMQTGRIPHLKFELMFGESPLAIPLSFENTKYPSIEERMGTLLQNREEARIGKDLYD